MSSSFSEQWIPIVVLFLSRVLSSGTAQTILLPSQTGLVGPSRPSSCPAPDPSLYFLPVIGILSHPGDGASGRLNNATNASYIASSYVKFVESAGARVIPLIYNEPMEIISQKLNMVNGVLFTGGWANTGLYYETAKAIFKKALGKNDAGDHFPVYAICLGFELLNMMISKDMNILETFSAANQASMLQFTEDLEIHGTVFERFSPGLLSKLSKECLVMQNHHIRHDPTFIMSALYVLPGIPGPWKTFGFLRDIVACVMSRILKIEYGVSPKRLQGNAALSHFFKILTTSTDKNDEVYVSTVQAYDYPVTGFQWHPEKNAFEWGSSVIPHSEDAVQVTQHVANFFIREARRSSTRPPLKIILDNLIYNYRPIYCGKAGKGYDEVYIFS